VTETNISAAMRGAIGSLLGRQVSYPVSASDIRKWALAVYYPNEPPRLFWDEAYAAGTVHGGIVAPEEFNPFGWMNAEPAGLPPSNEDRNDPDRTEKSLGIEGPGLKFQVNGGIEVAYGVRMRPGDVITAEQRLAGYRERPGRLGLMLFTSSESVWTNQRDELVKRTTVTIIRYGDE
jgi:N-terminal half of MaoC dehydratase